MGVVLSAGQLVSLAVLLMSVTGVIRVVTAHVPVPVVKGIQLGAGLSLIMSSGSSLLVKLDWTHPVLDNRLWALAAFLVLIATQSLPRFPYALLVFILSVLFAFISILAGHDDSHHLPWFQIWRPTLVQSLGWLQPGPVSMAVGQLPLTTLNSVIAVSALSADLISDMPAPSVTALGISVGCMNLVGGWFGAMPVCHGAGGLAGQYRFGARSGASVVMLGILKVLLGLVFGSTLVPLLSCYPRGLLGIMVVAAGLELAKVGNTLNLGAPDLYGAGTVDGPSSRGEHRVLSEDERAERWTVMLVTTAGLLAFRNDAVGFLSGMACAWAYRLSAQARGWYAQFSQSRVSERTPLLHQT